MAIGDHEPLMVSTHQLRNGKIKNAGKNESFTGAVNQPKLFLRLFENILEIWDRPCTGYHHSVYDKRWSTVDLQ